MSGAAAPVRENDAVKVLVSWLRELVDVPVGIEALAERLHLAGFELASITPLDPVPGPDGPTTGPDAVIDFEITANRPDALSVAGFAREVAALYDVPLRFRPAPPPPAPIRRRSVRCG